MISCSYLEVRAVFSFGRPARQCAVKSVVGWGAIFWGVEILMSKVTGLCDEYSSRLYCVIFSRILWFSSCTAE